MSIIEKKYIRGVIYYISLFTLRCIHLCNKYYQARRISLIKENVIFVKSISLYRVILKERKRYR